MHFADSACPFDLVFIDADKNKYREYCAMLLDLQLLRPGGFIVVDNTLWKGSVVDNQVQ